MKTENQDDTLLTSIISWLNKQAQAQQAQEKAKKSKLSDDEQDKSIGNSIVRLAESLSLVVLEVAKLTKTVANVTKVVNEHSTMIQDLYTVQTGILQLLKSDASLQTSASPLATNEKKKTEKPN